MPETPSGIDINAPLTLSVGWRSGQKTKLAQLDVGEEVAEAFRAVLQSTLDDLATREAEPWAPDADLTPETCLIIGQDELGDAPALSSEHAGASIVAALQSAESLPVLTPQDLPAGDLGFYAMTIGATPGDRATFLRRVNPRRGLKAGRLLTSYHDVLKRIEDPVFAFDDLIDIVFHRESAWILSQTAFVALFRAQETLMAQIPKWSAELSGHVPITLAGMERLSAKSIRDSRARVRLEAIVKRGHLADVTPDVIRARMQDVGLDPVALLDPQGQLILEEEDIPTVLQFLNEDLFIGALTNVGFRADKKAAR